MGCITKETAPALKELTLSFYTLLLPCCQTVDENKIQMLRFVADSMTNISIFVNEFNQLLSDIQ